MRDIVLRTPDKARVWNLLNQVIIKGDDIRHNRFLLRLSSKKPDSVALSMLNGHNSLVAGTYKYCLAEYMKVFKASQSDPLASLMLGITYVHMACQKFSADKNALVLQAWVFLNSYREHRGDCQESLYNLGRAMQQLSINHQAIHYYELALEQSPFPSRPGQPNLDLTKEIAFNLALLYKKSSPDLSTYYIRKYITVWSRGCFYIIDIVPVWMLDHVRRDFRLFDAISNRYVYTVSEKKDCISRFVRLF